MTGTPRQVGLFGGYLGLDMAAEAFFRSETAAVAEVDPGSSAIIAHHRPGLPNLGDVTRIDWQASVPGGADIVCAGWPCQPFSMAGRRRGTNDERALWPEVTRAVDELRCSVVVLENVDAIRRPDRSGHVELARATRDLAERGFAVAWRRTLASEAGAPHRRARCFLLAAHPDRPRLEGRQAVQRPGQFDSGQGGLDFAGRVAPPTWGCDACGGTDADCATCNLELRCGHAWGDWMPAVERWAEVTGWWPPPGRDGDQRLTGRLCEWMQGLPPGYLADVPGLTRKQVIRAAGNGVCPQQAMVAMDRMWDDVSAAAWG